MTTETRLQRADNIAQAFNAIEDKSYWQAAVGGTRLAPHVIFRSRSSMVRLVYDLNSESYSVTFDRASAAWGDFLAGIQRAVAQVTAIIAISADDCVTPLMREGKALLRVEYNAETKGHVVSLAYPGEPWKEPPEIIGEKGIDAVMAG